MSDVEKPAASPVGNEQVEGNSNVGGAVEKKPRRHRAFGAMKGMTTIAPGVDLTEPACPEWADLIEEKYGKGSAGE